MKLHELSSTLWLGTSPDHARGAVILLHGRGGSSQDIAVLADELPMEQIVFAVPEATGNVWYPQRFLVPLTQNEPWLSSALNVVDALVKQLMEAGLPSERIGLAGFSQGACLSLEYAYRHPRRYGFVGGLSGALIGPLHQVRPQVDLLRTPVLLGCARHDAHIPLSHVEESDRIFSANNADLTKIIFPGSDHTVFPEEIDWLRKQVRDWI